MTWPEQWARVCAYWGDAIPADVRVEFSHLRGTGILLRHPYSDSTVCHIMTGDWPHGGAMLGEGWASTHPGDRYVKSKGRAIAFRRAWAEAKKTLGLERKP